MFTKQQIFIKIWTQITKVQNALLLLATPEFVLLRNNLNKKSNTLRFLIRAHPGFVFIEKITNLFRNLNK